MKVQIVNVTVIESELHRATNVCGRFRTHPSRITSCCQETVIRDSDVLRGFGMKTDYTKVQ